MAYKCLDCGHIFEEGEQKIWVEKHGLTSPPYEEFSVCPVCNGSFEKTIDCKICGGSFLKDELNGKCICDSCLEEYNYNFDICYKIADTEKTEVEINSLLASLLKTSDIEAILYHYLKAKKDVDCSYFINKDKDWFAERLVEEVSKCQ